MSTLLKFATIAVLLAALASAAPAQAFTAKHHAQAHKKTHHHAKHRAHRHFSGNRHYTWNAHYYGPRHQLGHRPDCHQLKQRAVLTNNPYWRYAHSACHHDYYRKAY